tara:strand:+ start:1856 stop:1960 length:105 start_codon:yes stop_codon:yes gene_type:complete
MFITMGYAKSKSKECEGEKIKYIPYSDFDELDIS